MAFQQRKKDYLQRLIEEFFAKIQQYLNNGKKHTKEETEKMLSDGFQFFTDNFEVTRDNTPAQLFEKIPDFDLLEQYARFLLMEYEILESDGNRESLLKALDVVDYIDTADNTYSWERSVLREDILALL
jgi:hypothetical protein